MQPRSALFPFLFLFLIGTGPVFARTAADDLRGVLQAEREICAAYQREDADWLAKHLDPGFTLTSSRGVITTRDDEVADLRSGKTLYEVFRNRDSKVRFYGDTALVNGVTVVKGSSEGTPFAAEFQFTDTYVRRGRDWILVASHASRLQDAPPD